MQQAAATATAKMPLGVMHSTGDVLVGETKAPQEITIYTGDVVRVGAAGAATLNVAGKGELLVYEKTSLAFDGTSYFAELREGTVTLHSVIGAAGFQIKVGTILVAPDLAITSRADITKAADGSAAMHVLEGSMEITSVEGGQFVRFPAGQTVMISKDGQLLSPAPAESAPAAAPAAPLSRSSSAASRVFSNKLAVVGVAGGATALVIVLATRNSTSPAISPSAP